MLTSQLGSVQGATYSASEVLAGLPTVVPRDLLTLFLPCTELLLRKPKSCLTQINRPLLYFLHKPGISYLPKPASLGSPDFLTGNSQIQLEFLAIVRFLGSLERFFEPESKMTLIRYFRAHVSINALPSGHA